MDITLFSSPGAPFLSDVLRAARRLAANAPKPVAAYLPAGNLEMTYLTETRAAFDGVARIAPLNAAQDSLDELRAVLDRADFLYIPGGNTYLLTQRLHQSGWFAEIRQRLADGLPLVAFSAGAMVCGADVRTSSDLNACGCARFDGFGFLPYALSVHFPAVTAAQDERDVWLREFHDFHDTPILALEDGAGLHVTGNGFELIQGNAWKLEKRKMRQQLAAGKV